MRVQRLVWPEERIEHIAHHGVTRAEVEEVCFGTPWVRRAKSEGANPVYYVLGQTRGARHLFCVVIALPDGNGYPVTARPMTAREKRQLSAAKSSMTQQPTSRLPRTDSIRELAEFWDVHDLADFDSDLEDEAEPVFVRGTPVDGAIAIPLERAEADAVERLARSAGVSREQLLRGWVLQQLTRRR